MEAVKILIAICLFVFLFTSPAFAQSPDQPLEEQEITPVQDYRKAEVIKIIEEGEAEFYGQMRPYQKIELKILEGSDKDQVVTITHGDRINLREHQKVKLGEQVVLYRGGFNETVDQYQIIDKYRLNTILTFVIFFLVLVLAISRLKGLGSILGLALSFVIILKFIVPQILAGADPVLISIIGASFIMLFTIYLSHGFSIRTTVSLISIILTLIVTGILSFIFVKLANLTGLGDETAYALTFGPTTSNINFQGLFLGAIIIGVLGVLDDVATTQSAAVFELKKTDSRLSLKSLFEKGMVVGREHISALVNTLFLAYTGASLPLLLILILNPSQVPLWMILNNESIAGEIVRTVAGSIGLVLAVPITTLLAAYFVSRKR